MRFILVIIISFGLLVIGATIVFAHGTGEAESGSPMMFQMMEMMHGNLDKNRMIDCEMQSDAELIERGEEIMEQMMGHEAHEKVEEEMEKSGQEVHDNMHIMMGMWATGCIGDEAMNTLAERHGISQRLEELERKIQNQASWPMVVLGITVGAVGGLVVNQLLRKKSQPS